MTHETATFATGCFWGPEEYFRKLPGITSTAVGYMGGELEQPTYEDVSTGTTGHAEVTQLQFDPAVISYEALLDHFWQVHDPTQGERQGPDVGSQYRSIIFYHTPAQQAAAETARERLRASGKLTAKITTEIRPAGTFWRAEEYHQRYIQKTGRNVC